MDIHQRAEELVRASRGKMNKAEAYRELARRAAVSRRAKRERIRMKEPQLYWWGNQS